MSSVSQVWSVKTQLQEHYEGRGTAGTKSLHEAVDGQVAAAEQPGVTDQEEV